MPEFKMSDELLDVLYVAIEYYVNNVVQPEEQNGDPLLGLMDKFDDVINDDAVFEPTEDEVWLMLGVVIYKLAGTLSISRREQFEAIHGLLAEMVDYQPRRGNSDLI